MSLSAWPVAKRVRQMLRLIGLNKRELAARLGLIESCISQVARDTRRPGAEFLFALRRTLGVSTDWLITGEGGMYGRVGISPELFHAVRLQLATARAAVIDNDPDAKAPLTPDANPSPQTAKRSGYLMPAVLGVIAYCQSTG